MAINPVNIPTRHKGGGGLFGKIAGGIAGALGAIAAPATGGASLGATAAGFGLGSKIGETVGEAVKPSSMEGGMGVPTLESTRLVDPEVQLAALTDARKAATRLPKNQMDDVLNNFINPAINHLRGLK